MTSLEPSSTQAKRREVDEANADRDEWARRVQRWADDAHAACVVIVHDEQDSWLVECYEVMTLVLVVIRYRFEVPMSRPPPDASRLLEECQAALAESPAERAMREVVARAVSDPAALIEVLGEPTRAGIQTLHRSPTLTVLNVIWAPGMSVMPHDHRMWAVIGIYIGREDNRFWRRLRDLPGGKIEAAGDRTLETRQAVSLGRDIVHSVTNPVAHFTGALHVYGGDFFATQRSEWDPTTLLEQPYDVTKALRMFDEANAQLECPPFTR